MILNEIDLAFDIFDLETAKRYEAALKHLQHKQAQGQPPNGLVEIIRQECKAVFAFLDALFGKGTAKQVFGESCNLSACLDVAEAVVKEVARQKDQLEQRLQAYAPSRQAAGDQGQA